MSFEKANKVKQKLRLLLEGPSGSGKTFSALIVASALAKSADKRIAFIDTEYGSASLYADKFDFDVLELKPPFTPEKYISAIREASLSNDYAVLIIDSISHEWSGEGGCLDIQTKLGGNFNAWGKVTPRHRAFIDAILASNIHIIGCARTKSDYIMEEGVNRKGEATVKPVKVGTKTEQREGLEFEFTTIFRLNQEHIASVSKDRTSLFEGVDEIITEETGIKLLKWLNSGKEPKKSENKINDDTFEEEIPDCDIEFYSVLDTLDDIEQIKEFATESKDKVKNWKAFCSAANKKIKEIKGG